MKPFFIEILNFLAWADNKISFGAFGGIFGQFISTHFGTVSPLSIFFINQLLFLQETNPLYPNPKFFGGLGFEFEPQRIRDLAHVYR